jgi:hypothetical protein
MNKNEMIQLKDTYIEMLNSKLDKEHEIRNDIKTNSKRQNVLHNELQTKRNEMIRNKELRTEYNITNQKDWAEKVKELTIAEEVIVDDELEKMEKDLILKQDKLAEFKIEILDAKMGYDIDMVFIKEMI